MHKCVLTAFVMDIGLFRQMLDMDSTSGREREFAEFLAERLQTERNKVDTFEVGDGTLNVLISWGEPEVVFCSHLDTVPPYISPVVEIYDGTISPPVASRQPRGACRQKTWP